MKCYWTGDGNFRPTAAIAEMLLQSRTGEIEFLLVLPKTAWPNETVKGLRARRRFEIDLSWQDGHLVRAVLRYSAGKTATVRYGERIAAVTPAKGREVVFDSRLTAAK